jgi:hypothetical protein
MTDPGLERYRMLVSEMVMRRTKKSHLAALIVEGISDRKFYERLIEVGSCDVLPAGDRKKVIETIARAEQSRLKGFVGIIDGDTDHFIGRSSPHKATFRTDLTDAEAMMFRSPALETLVRETILRCDDARGAEKVLAVAATLRTKIVAAAMPLGVSRCLSAKFGWGIDYEGLVYRDFVDELTCVCDLNKFFRHIAVLPRKSGLTNKDLEEQLLATLGMPLDQWHVVRGHDLTRILSLCSPSALNQSMRPDEVEKFLRLAYERAFFQKTRLYKDVSDWSTNNQPYVVWSNS